MFCVHEKSCEVISVGVQAEKHPYPHIVYPALHCPVHSFSMPGVVAFRTCRVEGFIVRLVVSLLEKYVSADTGVLQFPIVLYGSGSYIHIHPADCPVAVMCPVNGRYGFENVFNGVVHRVFTGLDRQSLVSHVLQGDDFPADFILRELLSEDMSVFCVVRTIYTAVYTPVGKVQRCEHHYPVPVEFPFDFLCEPEHPADQLWFVALHQYGRLPVRESTAFSGFFQDTLYKRPVIPVGCGIVYGIEDFLVIDEFFGLP